ncbi:protein abrupt isoform X4 [Procambarus clarkii]|uniref:protein abrupt isoform X4 n=1 Tax=Procambarus clarkii TaxID=6728 RepID=UPI001E675269|nr:protein abrupt-like isoform X4 [Procambarus clarkii]
MKTSLESCGIIYVKMHCTLLHMSAIMGRAPVVSSKQHMIAMGSDQHFCLRWNNFHSNIATSFEHLRDHEDFVDVTLACEGRSLKAHKVVLSACSPYFRNLLKQNPCQHPIIILRDVAYVDMSALLSFVYQGEVYVSQDRLTTFLRTAEMLHIKGLTEQNQQQSHIAAHQLQRDQGGLVNKVVSSLGAVAVQGPSSPRLRSTPSPTSHVLQQPSHISPPPKKRRPDSSPTLSLPVSTAAPSTPPRSDVPSARIELSPRLESSTLAAALTKPLNPVSQRGDNTTRNSQPVPPAQLPPPPLLAAQLSTPDVPKVKQEDESEVVVGEEDSHIPDQAVNLVTEGSILRQRIQGYQGSSEAPSTLPPPPNISSSSRPTQALLHHHIVKDDSLSDDTNIGEMGVEMGDGGGEKEALSSPPPMVIRPPLMGLLPREAAGLYAGPGTSGSLGQQHESSQEPRNGGLGEHYAGLDAEYLVRACVPKLWNSRQPGICPICNRVFSNKFNLKQHIINIHTKGEGVECDLCHKKCKNKWYLRRHQVTHHGAPLKRNRNYSMEKYVNDENDQGAKDTTSE